MARSNAHSGKKRPTVTDIYSLAEDYIAAKAPTDTVDVTSTYHEGVTSYKINA